MGNQESSQKDGENLLSLPNGWIGVPLGEIAISISPGFPSGRHNKEKKGVLHFRPMNISVTGEIDLSVEKYVEESDYHPLLKGDIIFNNTNSPELVGKTTYVKQDTNWAYSNHMTKIRVNTTLLDPAWIASFLHTKYLQGYFKMQCTHHVNQASINSSYLSQRVYVPLPPLHEQLRIVTKIEELFTQLDAGVASLKKVQAQLKRYRQAVLKAAFEGRLTQEWREERKGKIEPADVLLKGIEQDRNNFGERSKKRHVASHSGALQNLPEGWAWAIVDQILQPNRICSYGVLQPGEDLIEGVLFVRVGDINEGKIALEGMKKISPSISEQYPRTLLEGDEVLMTLVGAIGRTAVVPKSLAGANVARAVGVIPVSNNLNPKWVELWFRYPPKVAEMTSKSHEVARKTLNLEDVRAAFVAIPPKDEQDKAVNEIERLFSIADEVEHTLETSLKQADTLRQSILKQAFEGKLAPQDPNDEPALILLERIKAEKAHHTAETKKGKTLQPKSPKRKIKNGN